MEIATNQRRIYSDNYEYFINLPNGVTPGLLARENKNPVIKQIQFYNSGDWIKTNSLSLGLPLSKLNLTKLGLLEMFNGDILSIPSTIELFGKSHLEIFSNLFPREELQEINSFENHLREKLGDIYRFRRI